MARSKYNFIRKRIYIAGHIGMVGSALVRRLEQEDCAIVACNRGELDLMDQAVVKNWLMQ
ncbi:sugar nucleotide-binding protein [Thalassospira marina]|uniref:RmlD-like substrate binding domain-containing protein n=1 Tax=Thalassospira marina TaxID=2048283 RepID=A0ABM6QDE2_9PROT|nr:sugar nucleotide-binding protein [Thalassospira marina]AUG54549.1 hypothetical protein CSC3H3_18870 [Thalassospira marina]